ncbi:MAG: hypothetical protein K8S55_02745 [Phycisphaerae bacterium]|nr:hypothetical protein [Phycisphaerae bacterium]
MAERKKPTAVSADDAIFEELAAGHFSRQTKQADKDSTYRDDGLQDAETTLEKPARPVVPLEQPPEPPQELEPPQKPDADMAEPSVEVEESQQQAVEEAAAVEEADSEAIEDVAEDIPNPDADLTMELPGHIGSVFVESPQQPDEATKGFDSPIDMLLTDPELHEPPSEAAESGESEIEELLRQQMPSVPSQSMPKAVEEQADTNTKAQPEQVDSPAEEEEDWDVPTTTENLAEEVLSQQIAAEAATKPYRHPVAKPVQAETRKVTPARRPNQGQFGSPVATGNSHVPIASIPKQKNPSKTSSLVIQLAIVALALAAAGALAVLLFLQNWW